MRPFFFYRSTTPDYMSLEIKTEAQNGVILWQGEVKKSVVMSSADRDCL